MMKKFTLIILVMLTGIKAIAQAPIVQWQRSLGGSSLDVGNSIRKTSDGGYIVANITQSTDGDVTMNHGQYEAWLVKLSPFGSTVWQKSYGGSNNEDPYAVQQTTDGGYVFAAQSNSTNGDVTGNHGSNDYWVVKVDDTGRIQWERSFGGSGQDVPLSMQQTADGGYVVSGFTESADGDVTTSYGGKDVWVIKLSATGNLVWQKTYGGSGDDIGSSIEQTADGGYIIGGLSNSTDGDVTGNHGDDDFWVVKLNDTGAIQWEHCYGGSGGDDDGDEGYPGTIQQTFDGGYILTGTTNSSDGDVTGFHGGTFFDYWVVKLSATGSLVWEKCLGGTNDDDGYCIQQTPDSNYIVAGTSNSGDGDITHNIGTYDYWIVKLSSTGSIAWQQNYGGTLDEYPYCIRAVSDSQFIVCGYTASNDIDVTGYHGAYDSWVLKLGFCSLPASSGISGPLVVCAGSSIQLSDITAGGTWSASNSNATVSSTGFVTGVYGGTDVIFYTSTNTCGTGGTQQSIIISQPTPVITRTGNVLSTTIPYITYQWSKNGTSISGATSATYTVTVNGVYTVRVSDGYSCTANSAGDTVTHLGVSVINNTVPVTIMPNPTTGTIYIKGAGNLSVKVYNIVGQLMKEADNTDNISIADFVTGIYVIRVFDEQGRFIHQEKILKE